MKYFLSTALFCSLIYYLYSGSGTSEINQGPKPIEKSISITPPKSHEVIDIFEGVSIYANGHIRNTYGRHLTTDGYNLGLKWQCVEFVKRYYYEKLGHKMPDSYGHAKYFFDKNIGTGWNEARGLYQFENGNFKKPETRSIVVFDGNASNEFGHVAIISAVKKTEIEVVQQNWGTVTRMTLLLKIIDGLYYIDHNDVLGWLTQ